MPVTPAVHRLIAKGNRARQRRDWASSAEAYGAALELDSSLAHIWIQYGHSLKEARRWEPARDAYRRALALRPEDSEPLIHLGHTYKLSGDLEAAADHYYRAVVTDTGDADAWSELNRMLARRIGVSRDRIAALIAQLSGDTATPSTSTLRQPGRTDRPSILFDASDLVSYFMRARLPTGIQRVQIEIISHALAGDGDVRVCCFLDEREELLEVPVDIFLELAQLSLASGDREEPAWLLALNRLYLLFAAAEDFTVPQGAWLVNLGTSWWLRNYFLFVRDAKARYGLRYIPFVHDLIPIVTPEHCLPELIQNFVGWAIGVFDHADFFLVNSDATRRDLLRVARELGRELDEDAVSIVRLDGDFRKPGGAVAPPDRLVRWRLGDRPFVLLVSTIESRKGHIIAFDAWSALIASHGAAKIPQLVCVGNDGWLNDHVYRRLATDKMLAKRVTMLSKLSDEELALLYTRCEFTIFPSFYEGWGLPITESLCYGKPVIAADSASLPEAGGEFALYVPAQSADALASAVARLHFDGGAREALAAIIRDDFRPRPWGDIAAQVEAEVAAHARNSRTTAARPPIARAELGRYYPLARNSAETIAPGMASTEMFRAGLGWHWPDHDGCWTRPEGGELAIGVPGNETLRICIQLRNPCPEPCAWRIDGSKELLASGLLAAGDSDWVQALVVPHERVVRLRLTGLRSAKLVATEDGALEGQQASVGIGGFLLLVADDEDRAQDFLAHATLGRPRDAPVACPGEPCSSSRAG